MSQRKTRIVNFRVTEEEYALLRSASLSQGLSAYARRASLSLAERMPAERMKDKRNGTSPEFFFASLVDLERRVGELETKFEVLTDLSERDHQSCA